MAMVMEPTTKELEYIRKLAKASFDIDPDNIVPIEGHTVVLQMIPVALIPSPVGRVLMIGVVYNNAVVIYYSQESLAASLN